MGFRTQGEPVAQDKGFILRKSGRGMRGQVGSQEAQPWVPRGEFSFNSIVNVKGDFRKKGRAKGQRTLGLQEDIQSDELEKINF